MISNNSFPKNNPPGIQNTTVDATQMNDKVDIRYLIKALVKYNASDLHLKCGRPPLYRIHGKLVPAKMSELTKEKLEPLLKNLLLPKQIEELQVKKQVDFSFQMSEIGRFRCNLYHQRGLLSAAIRMIPHAVPQLDQLGVPDAALKDLIQHNSGLILLTGPTGSGKSTTLASLVDYLNQTVQLHILTLEDPIEFIYRDQKSSITQKEVGLDILSIRDGLISGLRQDPDVIVIGEMRDAETIQIALTAAETGHLVIGTLHTNDAKGAIDRILDVFPAEAKNQVRVQLSSSLVGVLAQRLIPRADGSGRIPACEVLVKSPAIEGHILRNELEQIVEAMSHSNAYYKMQTMTQALEQLVQKKLISPEEAYKWAPHPDDLKLKLAGLDRGAGYSF